MGIKKLSLITLNKDTVEVDTAGLESIAQVKAEVAKRHAKSWPNEHLIRLINNGRILQDSEKIATIDTKKWVIILKLQPVKSKDRRSASMSATTRSTEKKSVAARMVRDSPRSEPARVLPIKQDDRPARGPSRSQSPARKPSRSQSPARKPMPPSSSSSAISQHAASSFVIGDEYENSVQTILSMGFGRQEAEKAMRMAFNNPNRATELLLSGAVIIDENMGNPPAPSPVTPQGAPAMSPHIAPFAKQLEVVKSLAKEKGKIGLKQGLDSLAKRDPAAFAAVKEDEKGFVRWINDEPLPEMTTSAFQHPPVALELTEEDRKAITRVAAMGFPTERVIDAYMMVGKNEAAAIELLLSTFHDKFDESHGNSSSSSGRPPPKQ